MGGRASRSVRTSAQTAQSPGYHQNATYVFNNGTSLPNFRWRVTATIPGATAVAPPTNCYVTGGPVTNTGGNVGDDGTADAANRPTGNVAVTVQSCGFAVRVQADYSRPPGVSTDPAVQRQRHPGGAAVAALGRRCGIPPESAPSPIPSSRSWFRMPTAIRPQPPMKHRAIRPHSTKWWSRVRLREWPCMPGSQPQQRQRGQQHNAHGRQRDRCGRHPAAPAVFRRRAVQLAARQSDTLPAHCQQLRQPLRGVLLAVHEDDDDDDRGNECSDHRPGYGHESQCPGVLRRWPVSLCEPYQHGCEQRHGAGVLQLQPCDVGDPLRRL